MAPKVIFEFIVSRYFIFFCSDGPIKRKQIDDSTGQAETSSSTRSTRASARAKNTAAPASPKKLINKGSAKKATSSKTV